MYNCKSCGEKIEMTQADIDFREDNPMCPGPDYCEDCFENPENHSWGGHLNQYQDGGNL